MLELPKLHNPWLVTAWPGMGHVARSAAEYLANQLPMRFLGELPAERFFEPEHVEVKRGLITPGQRPRCLVFAWQDPGEQRDVLLLIGESQPQAGGYALCQYILEHAQRWGVTRLMTFAAMATQMHPQHDARVFGVASDKQLLRELTREDVEPLEEGQVSGLNGLMLAAARERGIQAACLLGEMPYFAVQIPNPKAARVVLDVFVRLADLELNFAPLEHDAEQIDQQLVQLLKRLQEGGGELYDEDDDDEDFTVPDVAKESAAEEEESELDPQSRRRIERLFEQAEHDRSKAAELKRELERLEVFKEYEDRFLDLFKRGA